MLLRNVGVSPKFTMLLLYSSNATRTEVETDQFEIDINESNGLNWLLIELRDVRMLFSFMQ
jgi:hypothetical protein